MIFHDKKIITDHDNHENQRSKKTQGLRPGVFAVKNL